MLLPSTTISGFCSLPSSSRPNPQIILKRYSPRLLGSEHGKLLSELAIRKLVQASYLRGKQLFGRLASNGTFKGWLMRFLPLLSAPSQTPD